MGFAARYTDLRGFAAKNSQAVEKDRERAAMQRSPGVTSG
jgi:hypothetical protein